MNQYFEKIAILENEVQARLLDAALTDRNIPHMVLSHHSNAYDGIFQLASGWGHVEAPAEFKQEIEDLLTDLRQPPASSR